MLPYPEEWKARLDKYGILWIPPPDDEYLQLIIRMWLEHYIHLGIKQNGEIVLRRRDTSLSFEQELSL